MLQFKPRLSAPSKTNKFYISDEHGGLNPCIIIEGNSCLPNCVGYAFGRVYEILGTFPKLARYNAEDWYNYTTDGYTRGRTPKLGAVMCWKEGKLWTEKDGAGHIGVVEKITPSEIIVSMSAYKGKRWYIRKFSIGKYDYNGFIFQGFIYLPINFSNKEYTTGDYIVTTNVLNVRKGHSTSYDRLSFEDLTPNAQEQILSLCGYECNGYCCGVECTVYEVKDNWGKTPSGWICLDYCEKL